MIRLQSALKEVCECDLSIRSNMPLGDIEGWDSMRAVNYQLALESIFSVDLSDVLILGESTLSDVAELLRQKGVELSPLPGGE